MGNKQWNFKVPGNPEGKEIVIASDQITTVYDLLDMLRQEEPQTPQKDQPEGLNPPQPRAAVIPFISRMLDKRRHPSA
ncbi:hypothetical protein QW71_25795 [Paenibacillus sp. IHB B 3415]|uniref:hypothetical protein n=1 Tax=Paenibacillus sp. IHB B 3415 TaxID=867080 RepID=UPI000575183B|nr:hypothetical protein [Paenibacillus sp. IHB B 3415]KHL93080.1 hypothetical protein QW71_25795 [Paenibacillus sp. IHB B 3415]